MQLERVPSEMAGIRLDYAINADGEANAEQRGEHKSAHHNDGKPN